MLDGFLDDHIREYVLEAITPSNDEIKAQQAAIDTLTRHLSEVGQSTGVSYKFILPQGSTGAKQTQLSGAADIDLFVGINPEDFSDILNSPSQMREEQIHSLFDSMVDNWFIPAVKPLQPFHIKKTYSEHPYLSLKLNGLEIDIVSCFALSQEQIAESGPITAVDRTVHHTQYVTERIDDKLREDIRILKSFVRAAYSYGDKCAIGRMGLTGYALELLVLSGDGLKDALDLIRNIESESVDPMERSIKELKNAPNFRDDYIFIMDPTDLNRNAASSFSERTVRWVISRTEELVDSVKAGILSKTKELLLETPISSEPIAHPLSKHTYTIEFESDESVHYTILRDKLYSLALSVSSRLQKERTGECRFGNVITELVFEDVNYCIGFLIEQPIISNTYSRRGPPIKIQEGALKFREAHPTAYEENGHLWVNAKREWTKASDMIEHLLQGVNIEGIKQSHRSDLSNKTLHIIIDFVLQIEPLPTISRLLESK